MGLRSMTGIGLASGQLGGTTFSVEARSVNHKGLDIKVTLPGSLAALEPVILNVVRERLARGRVQVRVSHEHSTDSGARSVLDIDAAVALAARLEQVRQRAELPGPVTLEHLLAIPSLVLRNPEESLAGVELWDQGLSALVDEALEALSAERDREGQALADDMTARLETLAGCIERIAAELPVWRQGRMARLRERVVELTDGLGIEEVSQERLAQEIVLLSERVDIAEEITRARAHVAHLLALIPGHDPDVDGPVGKKLDFYFQELIRETNTMGSKSQSEVIAACVVEMRSEIDRLREQVLNIA